MRVAYIMVLVLALAACGKSGGPVAPRSSPGAQKEPIELFDGKSLDGWKRITDWEGGGGSVSVEDGFLVIGPGEPMNGVVIDAERWVFPDDGAYEIHAEVSRVEGSDIFFGLTFPVPGRDACMTFVAGGWGGGVTGFSSIGGMDASMNETRSQQKYENGKWYAFRLKVGSDRLMAWIDERIVASTSIRGQVVGMRPGEVEMCQPMGLITWRTKSALRKLTLVHGAAD